MTKLAINKWDKDDRPREKLTKLGAAALSKSELMAILIGSGSADESAVALMRRILSDCGDSISALSRQSLDTLCRYKGIGLAKAVTIQAACELGKRMQAEAVPEKQAFNSPRLVSDYFAPRLEGKTSEECWVMLLNQKLCLIRAEQISKGGITEATVDVRLVLRAALLAQSPAIILVHNHPSGSPAPSACDNRLTDNLAKAAALMNIRLADHVIIGGRGNYYSYAETGKYESLPA